jgi:hypothetical protein
LGVGELRYDYMMIKYDDFRDVGAGGVAGAEPLDMERSIVQVFARLVQPSASTADCLR